MARCFAWPAKLPKGTLLTAGKLTIQEAEINRAISKSEPVTDQELKTFYNENRDMVGGAPLDEAKDMLKNYLAQQKQQEALQVYIQTLGQRTPIQVNEEWVKMRNLSARDNPVDQAKLSGRPSLVDFGATGCGPCDRR